MSDFESDIELRTDHYFKLTKSVVNKHGDVDVTYAIFMRRPVIYCSKLAIEWINLVINYRGGSIDIKECFEEGAWVGAGEVLMYLSGRLTHLADLETIFLQKLGGPCVAAYNAFGMTSDLANVAFIAMDARHCAGAEMQELMAYGASVGSRKAQKEQGAIGFVGSANDLTAHFFGKEKGIGTMPHALVGYAGSTVNAAKLFVDTYPNEPLTVLIDYFGREITDSLEVCEELETIAKSGNLSLRIDTHGGRFVEGLDTAKSYEILDQYSSHAIRTFRTEQELKWLVGTGVSAAAIIHLRQILDNNGWDKVKIVASSGFSPEKCKLMASVKAPIDIIGTGSYLPENWSETYATADIVAYGGKTRVKMGREFLLPVGDK
ncbi:MAG: nicotinate phosphoribosyltransferase [Pelagibacterales bacterium]|nr:nicotinate phosphoribosyltransferase [Pelagibacterales bacterium]